MDPSQAKLKLAAYLAGEALPPQEVQSCWEAIQADNDHVLYLLEELGLAQPASCDTFAERAPEFSEMTTEQRQREAPELAAHAESCPRCRALLWELKSFWARAGSAATLAEPLTLALFPTGELAQRGLGPPGRVPEARARAADVPRPGSPTPEGVRREWLLEDPESRCTLRLVVRGLKREVALGLSLESPTPAPWTQQADLKVYDTTRNRLYLAGTLAEYQSEPLLIPPGTWKVLVEARPPQGRLTWEVPLVLQTEEADDSNSPV
jgi:hypothetical protein